MMGSIRVPCGGSLGLGSTIFRAGARRISTRTVTNSAFIIIPGIILEVH